MTEAEKKELRKAFEQMLEEERGFIQVNTSHVQEGIGNVATQRKKWTITINFTEEYYS